MLHHTQLSGSYSPNAIPPPTHYYSPAWSCLSIMPYQSHQNPTIEIMSMASLKVEPRHIQVKSPDLMTGELMFLWLLVSPQWSLEMEGGKTWLHESLELYWKPDSCPLKFLSTFSTWTKSPKPANCLSEGIPLKIIIILRYLVGGYFLRTYWCRVRWCGSG